MAEVGHLERTLQPVVEDHGMEVVDLELLSEGGGKVLRLFIDRPDGSGVTVEDCACVSRECSVLLDAEDAISGQYRLEVSSPGIERRLRKKEHYERHVGESVRAMLRKPVERRRRFTGTLQNVQEKGIVLEIGPDDTVFLPFKDIKKANLKVF